MPIGLQIWERRDSGDREVMGNTAVELCRIVRAREGITSSKFYWSGTENVIFITEGAADALNTPFAAAQADGMRAAFILADNARMTMSMRLAEPRESLETYRAAGR